MEKTMENLKDMICTELEEIAHKGEMSAGDLDTVYKLIVSKEKLLRIDELEEKLGYSEDGRNWRGMETLMAEAATDGIMCADIIAEIEVDATAWTKAALSLRAKSAT